MSTLSPSTQVDDGLTDSRVAQLSALVRRPFEALAFWAAIALPFAYLPLLYGGLDGTANLLVFAALVVANVLALYAGHDHRRN